MVVVISFGKWQREVSFEDALSMHDLFYKRCCYAFNNGWLTAFDESKTFLSSGINCCNGKKLMICLERKNVSFVVVHI